MSEQNLEIVRRAYDAFEQGDVDVALAIADPEMVVYRAAPDGATHHGPDGFMQALAEWTENFEQFTSSAEELIDAGDKIVVRVNQTATGAQSGVPITSDFWFIHTFRGDKVVRLDMFNDQDQAFEYAGLDRA